MAANRSFEIAEFSKYRADFPGLARKMHGQSLAFLDTAASAQKPQAVINAMNDVMTGGYANIHRGLYEISQTLTQRFEDVRLKVAKFIGAATEREIVFTRNATEAINLVAQSWGRANLTKDDEIILTQMEHHANIVPWQLLQDEIGFHIKVIPVLENGTLDLEAYQKLLSPKTKLVCVVHISNALGTINPAQKIIETAKAYDARIHTLVDGSQSVVHNVINVAQLGADFFVFTGHKLYGPTGIGVLYGRYDVLNAMRPYQGGGDMIERVSFNGTTYKEAPYKFEAGTPAIIEVIGLGAAIDYVQSVGLENIAAHEAQLLGYATQELQKIEGVKIMGNAPEKAGIIAFTTDFAHPSDIGMVLDQCGVAVRAGHHCCMPLMQRFGVDATVRASIGLYNNKDDIDALVRGVLKAKELFS